MNTLKPSSLVLLALAVLSLGCPKKAPIHVAGTDDEQMDQLSAKLEEARVRVQAEDGQCQTYCELASDVCEYSSRMCAVSSRNADRTDMQQRCVTSQEQCARFNDGCAPCR